MIQKIKVKYNQQSTKVEGYFPNAVKYKNNTIDEEAKTIDGSPYIEITNEEHQAAMGKTMCVIDGVLQEYIKPLNVRLEEATQAKIKEIKAQRDTNLCKPTPQTVTYGGKLSNRTFNINVKEHLPIFNSIITILQSKVDAGAINPTRTWTDANGDVLELELSDYISLANHLDFRDAQEYAMCSKRIKALDGLSLEEVENFDITQIIE